MPYRIHLLTAVETDASLPSRLEQELSSDLASRVSGVVGGAWRLETSVAPAELRHRILHSMGGLTAEDLGEIAAAIGHTRAGAGPVRADEPSRRKTERNHVGR